MKYLTYRSIFFVLISILYFLSYVGINYSYTLYHETAHAMIDHKHGCEEMEIKTGIFGLSGSEVCLDRINISKEERLQSDYLHSLNEIKGYHDKYLNSTLFVIGYFLLLIWWTK